LDGGVYIWSLSESRIVALLERHNRRTNTYVFALAALPGGLLASGSSDNSVHVWNVAARACVVVLEGHVGAVRALAVLPDGRLASGADDDPVIRVWALTASGSPEDAAARTAAARCAEVPAGSVVEEAAAKGGCSMQ
jgi:WD40 repeat protein